MTRLVVLGSGSGTNLQAILDACADGRLPAEVAAVVSNKAGQRCACDALPTAGVPYVHVAAAARRAPRRLRRPPRRRRQRLRSRLDRARRLDAHPVDELPRLVPRHGHQPAPGAARRAARHRRHRAGLARGAGGQPRPHRRDGPPRARRGRRRRTRARPRPTSPSIPTDTLESLTSRCTASSTAYSSTTLAHLVHDRSKRMSTPRILRPLRGAHLRRRRHRPRLQRRAARHRRHRGHVRRRHHPHRADRLGGDGQGHRGTHGDRRWPARAASA